VFAVSLDPAISNWTVFQLADKLRERGWLIPAYTLPANCESLAVLRLVIRAGFSRDMADVLLEDMERAVDWFERLDAPMPSPHDVQPSFHH
jgi:glutamate decarboxylase